MLYAFLALAECGQFTLAAKRCHLSQSALSQIIGRLEAQARVRLFDRNTRRVALTPEGELFMQAARRLTQEMEAALSNLRDLSECRQGKVAIAAMPSLCADWLPQIIAEFRHLYPGVKVQLFDTFSDKALDLLRNGTVDFALNAKVEHLQEFESKRLFDERFYVVCARDHALAKRKRIAMTDLAGHAYVQSLPASSVSQQLKPFVDAVPVVHTGLYVENLSTLAGLVANNVGVSVVPCSSLFQFRRSDIVAIPLAGNELQRALLVLKPQGRILSVAARTLLGMIESNTPEMSKFRPVRAGGVRRAREKGSPAST